MISEELEGVESGSYTLKTGEKSGPGVPTIDLDNY